VGLVLLGEPLAILPSVVKSLLLCVFMTASLEENILFCMKTSEIPQPAPTPRRRSP
jgi:hypothetical protein